MLQPDTGSFSRLFFLSFSVLLVSYRLVATSRIFLEQQAIFIILQAQVLLVLVSGGDLKDDI